ncbi:MAG: NUDIX domain-containing protein [Propionibacteriaceae bacterium]|jgi:8-oxo-dGTP pyrophosphatase MutT (NUDIX family)|nr:NUDIX domain-containing protein [Propionibacteriaceae bacterium]
MRIVGVPVAGGPAVVDRLVGHAEDPVALLRADGYVIRRLLSVTGLAPDLVVTVQLGRRHELTARLARRRRVRSPGPGLGEVPRRQRVAAYAIGLSDSGLLATQFSDRTAAAGLWGLPGGGLLTGESAAQAVVREVEEETSQRIRLIRVLDIQSDHWVGQSPAGPWEDFHALRLIYLGRIDQPSRPVVVDVGGTTAAASWVPLNHWRQVPWSSGHRAILGRHLERLIRTAGEA